MLMAGKQFVMLLCEAAVAPVPPELYVCAWSMSENRAEKLNT